MSLLYFRRAVLMIQNAANGGRQSRIDLMPKIIEMLSMQYTLDLCDAAHDFDKTIEEVARENRAALASEWGQS